MRLNRYIASSTGASRREADGLIASGRVTVNNQPAELGQQVGEGDVVKLKGEIIAPLQLEYVRLNKPIGYVCSRRQQGEWPTIYSLLPTKLHHLQVAGRLDQDSSGLVMLTNDGEFAHYLTHPRFEKTKSYDVQLDKPLKEDDIRTLKVGVTLEDGLSKLTVDGAGRDWHITMHEGRNRQIRRTFTALGYTVTALHRTKLGPYTLEKLGSGEYDSVDKIT